MRTIELEVLQAQAEQNTDLSGRSTHVLLWLTTGRSFRVLTPFLVRRQREDDDDQETVNLYDNSETAGLSPISNEAALVCMRITHVLVAPTNGFP